MPDTVQGLLDEIAGVVDITPAEALTYLNRRHRRMVARGRSLRKRLEVGPTVAGQARYAVSGVVEVLGVTVGGVPYGKANRVDLYSAGQGTLSWCGPGGLVVTDADASGNAGLTLIPTPSDAGVSIELYAAVFPADLVAGDPASAVKVDPDYLDLLVDAAAATKLRRIQEGDPDTTDMRFEAACEDFRARVNRRFRGGGPAQIRIQGVNA